MISQDARFKKLELALFNRPANEAAFFAAHARAFDLRQELRELELQIAQAREILDLIPIRPWPPLSAPVRPPTLHQAIGSVLGTNENEWMRARDVAREVALRSLYRRRDGPLVRLRIDPPGVTRRAAGRSPAPRTA